MESEGETFIFCHFSAQLVDFYSSFHYAKRKEWIERFCKGDKHADRVMGLAQLRKFETIDGQLGEGVIIPVSAQFILNNPNRAGVASPENYSLRMSFNIDNYCGKIYYDPNNTEPQVIQRINRKEKC
jgi:hypothetical protein